MSLRGRRGQADVEYILAVTAPVSKSSFARLSAESGRSKVDESVHVPGQTSDTLLKTDEECSRSRRVLPAYESNRVECRPKRGGPEDRRRRRRERGACGRPLQPVPSPSRASSTDDCLKNAYPDHKCSPSPLAPASSSQSFLTVNSTRLCLKFPSPVPLVRPPHLRNFNLELQIAYTTGIYSSEGGCVVQAHSGNVKSSQITRLVLCSVLSHLALIHRRYTRNGPLLCLSTR